MHFLHHHVPSQGHRDLHEYLWEPNLGGHRQEDQESSIFRRHLLFFQHQHHCLSIRCIWSHQRVKHLRNFQPDLQDLTDVSLHEHGHLLDQYGLQHGEGVPKHQMRHWLFHRVYANRCLPDLLAPLRPLPYPRAGRRL